MVKVFVSYTSKDQPWAEWVAWILEENGYEVFIQAWYIRPGHDFINKMQQFLEECDVIVPILSPTYLQSKFCQSELNSICVKDPVGKKRMNISVRVDECDLPYFLSRYVYIDIVGKNESEAEKALLDAFKESGKPTVKPPFPGGLKQEAKPTGKPRFPAEPQEIWMMPEPNPFFTGREDTLQSIQQNFQTQSVLAITQAIHGMGGVGKSETAVEYAHRFRGHYDAVFWVRAETPTEWKADLTTLGQQAGVLSAGQAGEEDVKAVQEWLAKQTRWLMVLDNVEDISVVKDILPNPHQGHILVTTRSHALGRFQGIDLDCLPVEEGALLLLRRAKCIEQGQPLESAEEAQKGLALQISKALGGLPLALDQAGVYLEEKSCALDDYLKLFNDNKQILGERGELGKETHPDPVTVTFEMCFNKVKEENPAAAKMLQLCAFLAPDDIPHEIFQDGAEYLPEPLKQAASDLSSWHNCIAAAIRYSLIKCDRNNNTFSIHRLVQIVLRERLDLDERKLLVESCVDALNQVFPHITNLPTYILWPQFKGLIPQINILVKWIYEYKLEKEKIERLFNQSGVYLKNFNQLIDSLLRKGTII